MSEVAFWFRRDLRLQDNIGLFYAVQQAKPIHLFFIFDSQILEPLPKDDHRVTFIWNTLKAINQELNSKGLRLNLLLGNPVELWPQILRQNPQIKQLYFNHDYEPYALSRDKKVMDEAQKLGVKVYSFKDQVVFEGREILTAAGEPYRVYTPYKRAWLIQLQKQADSIKNYSIPWHDAVPGKTLQLNPPVVTIKGESIQEIGFTPSFIEPPAYHYSPQVLKKYGETRNFPALEGGTTHLGVALRFGTVSVRSCVRNALRVKAEVWLSELIWREFFMQILYHYPSVVNRPFRPEFECFDYRFDEKEWSRWKNGETGIPLVDAGMRELNQTGYMHNRVRMMVASFLCKSLLHSWTLGERYFASKLYDFDLSANVGNWQWAAGCGVDAAPYFRIFNPELQTQKFDPEFKYIKKWVPEWGTSRYPRPMVDHRESRQRALWAYAEMKKKYEQKIKLQKEGGR